MKTVGLTGLVITLAVAAAACGGDDGGAAATTAVVTTTTTTLPTTTTSPEVTYVIQRGDSLSKIADQFGMSVQQIITINGIENADHIEVGQVLIIVPAGTPLPTTTLAPVATTAAAPPVT